VQRCSAQSNVSLSEFLRQCIIHELASPHRQAPGIATGVDPPGRAPQYQADDRRRLCAEMIASILLDKRVATANPEHWRSRNRRAANLIEMLLRLLTNAAEADDRTCIDPSPASLTAPGHPQHRAGLVVPQADQPQRRSAG
jgi:hypothetical protein